MSEITKDQLDEWIWHTEKDNALFLLKHNALNLIALARKGLELGKDVTLRDSAIHSLKQQIGKLRFAIKEGGLVAAAECRLNATYHIRIMNEALMETDAIQKESK